MALLTGPGTGVELCLGASSLNFGGGILEEKEWWSLIIPSGLPGFGVQLMFDFYVKISINGQHEIPSSEHLGRPMTRSSLLQLLCLQQGLVCVHIFHKVQTCSFMTAPLGKRFCVTSPC